MGVIICAAAAVLSAAVGAFLFFFLSGRKREPRALVLYTLCFAALSVIVNIVIEFAAKPKQGIFAATGLSDAQLPLIICASLLASLTAALILYRFSLRKDSLKVERRDFLFALCFCLVLSLFCELIVFNHQAFKRVDGPSVTYTAEDMRVSGLRKPSEDSNLYTPTNAQLSRGFELRNVNHEVSTIRVKASGAGKAATELTISYRDEALNKSYQPLPAVELCSFVPSSEYIGVNLAGDVQALNFSFALGAKDVLQFESVTINERIPFFIMGGRVLAVWGLLVLAYLLWPRSRYYSIKFNWNSKRQRVAISALMIVLIFIMAFTGLTSDVPDENLGPSYNSNDAYNRLTRALRQGQVSLLEKPSTDLMMLQNPYDVSERNESGANYLWDFVYFEGDYYVYFGIVPVLMLHLPVNLITGQYLLTNWAVLIYCVLAALGLCALLIRIVRSYFPKIPFLVFSSALLIICSATLLFWVLRRPMFYEIAAASSLAFCAWGVYFTLRAVTFKPEFLKKSAFVGALLLALAVGCRPNAIFASLLIFPILIPKLREGGKLLRRENWRSIALIAAPYVVVGIALMAYNYARFGSFVEFGTSYQLTVYDVRKYSLMDFAKLPFGFWAYLFRPVQANVLFPFVYTSIAANQYMGYVFNFPSYGMFNNLALWFFALFPWASKWLRLHKNKGGATLLLSFAVLGLFVVVMNILMGGILIRYMMDFAWLLVIASCLVAFTVYESLRRKKAERWLYGCLAVAMIATVGLNLLLSISGESNWFRALHPDMYYALKYAVAFWL